MGSRTGASELPDHRGRMRGDSRSGVMYAVYGLIWGKACIFGRGLIWI
jgi:hypothetical protein